MHRCALHLNMLSSPGPVLNKSNKRGLDASHSSSICESPPLTHLFLVFALFLGCDFNGQFVVLARTMAHRFPGATRVALSRLNLSLECHTVFSGHHVLASCGKQRFLYHLGTLWPDRSSSAFVASARPLCLRPFCALQDCTVPASPSTSV